MFDLQAYKLRITLEATELIALERYAGSSLRGALFEALLRRFCMNQEASSCADCPLNATCPVAGLVAPLRDEHPRGRDIPRPFVLAAEPEIIGVSAPSGKAESAITTPTLQLTLPELRLQEGQTFAFEMTLFGQAERYFPYIALSLMTLATLGIGRPVSEHKQRRGRPRLVRIEAIQPFTEERETLYAAGEQTARKPSLVITPAIIAARAVTLPTDRLIIRFTTPMRLIAEKRLLHHPEFRPLALRLVERLEALEQEYGQVISDPMRQDDDDSRHTLRRERYLHIGRLTEAVAIERAATEWVELNSHSRRQSRSMPIGGFIGEATLAGELGPLRELLVWGEVAHAGKNAVKGDGRYHLAPPKVASAT